MHTYIHTYRQTDRQTDRQTSCERRLWQIVANISVKRFHIVTRSYAASFSIRRVFVKLTTFSTTKETKNETKPMHDSESTSKVRVRSRWTFFTYVCSHLHLKSFAWKRNYTISSKVKKPRS